MEHPMFFAVSVDQLLTIMAQIANVNDLDGNVRRLALEFLATIVEGLPSLIRKKPNFVRTTTQVAMNMMLKIDDDTTEWLNNPSNEDDDEEERDVAEGAVDRIAQALTGQFAVP